MATATEQELRVGGIGAAIPTAVGPSLSGTVQLAIAVTVSGADGIPLGGLSQDNFTVSALLDEGATATQRRVVTSVNEPLPGVYVLKLDKRVSGRLHRPFACVVDVLRRVDGAAPVTWRGRALVAIEN